MKNMRLKLKIIEEHGSQSNFAQAARIREPVVSRVINQKHELSEDEKRKWARKLGCPVEGLFPVEDEVVA